MSNALLRDEAPAEGGQIVDRELWGALGSVRAHSWHEARQHTGLRRYQLAAKQQCLASRQSSRAHCASMPSHLLGRKTAILKPCEQLRRRMVWYALCRRRSSPALKQ